MCELMQGTVGSGEIIFLCSELGSSVPALVNLQGRWHLYSVCLCPLHLTLRLLPKLHGLSWRFLF